MNLYGDIVLLKDGLHWVRDIGQRVDYESVTGIYREGREDDYRGIHGYVAYDSVKITEEQPTEDELSLYSKIVEVSYEQQQLLRKYLNEETDREDYDLKSNELYMLEEEHRKLTSKVYNKVVTLLGETIGGGLSYLYMGYDNKDKSASLLVKYEIEEDEIETITDEELNMNSMKLHYGKKFDIDDRPCIVHQVIEVDLEMNIDEVEDGLKKLRGKLLTEYV